MPSRRPSPLAPLHELRERHADEAARLLRAAIDLEIEQKRALDHRISVRADLEAQRAVVRARETEELATGLLRAGDMEQASRWETGAAQRVAAAAEQVRAGESSVREAGAQVAASRDRVAEKRADADAVAKLMDKARAREDARSIAAAEEAAEESFAARARCGVSR